MRVRVLAVTLCLLAAALGGLAGCRKSAASGSPAAPAPTAADPFQDVTDTAGIHWVNVPPRRPMRIVESVGCGGGFLDFDQDGYQDVLLMGTPRCGLFHNRKDGTFEDVTQKAGLGASGEWIGCAVGDYDNDGYPDLLITGFGKCALYHNQRNGTFADVTERAGVGMAGKFCTTAAFADFDGDGRSDLYIGTYVKFPPGVKEYCVLHQSGIKTACRPVDYDPELGHCFRNRGDGTFEDVSQRWGFDKVHGKNLGAVVADYDGDGWPDLYLANDEMAADLLHNEHGHGFRNVAAESGTAYAQNGQLMGGMGADWGDYDNDGWLDLAVGTFESEDKSLFHSLRGKSFEFTSGIAGILRATYPDVVFGTLLFDYDSDGWLDLLFVNGHVMDNINSFRPTIPYRQPARLFHNRHDGTFELATSAALSFPIAGRGLACADYDNSGKLSVLVVDTDGKVRLLKNHAGAGSHWLEVSARGTKSSRDAYGARVRLTVGGEHRTSQVSSGRSFLSACDPRVYFGLGSATRVEEVEVRWPSGAVTRLHDVPADQVLHVTEGE